MPVSQARAAAFEILLRVERDQSYAPELLHSKRTEDLSAADQGLTTELVMGVLRWRSVLDRELAAASSQPLSRLDAEVLAALRIGSYQMMFLSRIPARAAIFESVEIVKSARKRSAAPFVNAVLRKISTRTREHARAEIQSASAAAILAENSAHPKWLVGRWVDSHGFEVAKQTCVYDQTIPQTVIHVADDQTAEELIRAGITLAPGLLLSTARRVLSGDVTKTKAYLEGRVQIQDEASQLVAHLAGGGERILDCCAAPGTKTSLLARQNPQATIFASDIYSHRTRLLRELVRQPNVRVATADARQLPFNSNFDLILADVPCSGTGTLARNPEIKWRLKEEDLFDLQARQIAILKSALRHLAPGGRLVYSTCSLEREENEVVVEAALLEIPDRRLVSCREELDRLQRARDLVWEEPASLTSGMYLRTLPGVHPCDGFFAAMLERTQ